ncbi:hypothetical protein CSB08_01395 [Candidatus Gracilibacteria bacterium]|nr:MAG: hypothetical protein CSB08_01395 [Candidatus Gracilibacteria bacterium]PIE85376.1 MAG: hypothetical protein CSA08_02250 [Candidatus Gracilibacteria bacterium]
MEYIDKTDKKVNLIIKKVSSYMTNLEESYIRDEINKAYIYAKDAHKGQLRMSGEPYITHPVEATIILLDLKPDIPSIQACLLHDVIEDTPKTSVDISNEFGEEVSFLCQGMEKLGKVRYSGEDRDIGSLRKMFVAMAEDLRVVFIKLSDRLHNMRTIQYQPKREKRIKIALETLNIYAPIADRLGLFNLKNDLELECFKTLELKKYRKIKKELKTLEESCKYFLDNVEKEIDRVLEGKISGYEIDYRIKSIYSIYKKMNKKGCDNPHDLYDIFGIRVIVDSVSDCYKALGLIHNEWKPIPNKFKDYIALPKPNGYKSLHTTTIGLLKQFRKQPTEIQIKTFEMKRYAEVGVAAHFGYKEKGSSVANEDIDWVKELKELTQSLGNKDFMSSLKIDVFKDRIFVFTRTGDNINLPAGSTPIDFAYYIHTDLGNHIAIAKVNNNVYPLDKELCNGDVVDIVIDKNKKPNPFWLSFVKTAKAKKCIKSFLKIEDKESNRERGKGIMNKYLVKSGLSAFDKNLSILRIIDGRENNIEERWLLLEQVGNFSITPSSLFRKILKAQKIVLEKKEIGKEVSDIIKKDDKKSDIIIGGEENLKYTLCYCSRRRLPDRMVAHINNKGVITIHNRKCKVLEKVNTDRLLSAYRAGEHNDYVIFKLEFIFKNRIGVLKELSEIIYFMNINIYDVNSNRIDYNTSHIVIKVEILDYDYMIIDRLMERIRLNFKDNLCSSEFSIEK